MVATVQQILGKINPRLYASNGKDLLRKYGSPDNIPAEEVKPQALRYVVKNDIFKVESVGFEASHQLVYDSSSETLEPIYFFILDLINDRGFKTEKLVDNFSPTPGSGHFSELGQRATIMQQQAGKILGDVNTVIRSVLNVIYDLKEFRMRIEHYNDMNSSKKEIAESSLLALKQIWMDKVDIAKGNSSIKAMALGQAGYQTLIDAFLVAKDEKAVAQMDLNERVKRILLPRINEFKIWLKQSERELRKRYELEKTYLKSQVNSLKLYSRWAKPYLLASQQLERTEMGREPALVKAFNTLILELTILGKTAIDVKQSAIQGELPMDFDKLETKRKYYSCTLVNFRFRGIPQKVGQQSHYAFGGRAEVVFSSYALNEDELKKLDEELADSDVSDVLELVEGATTESLKDLQDEINFFLEEKDFEAEASSQTQGSNPFAALFGSYNKKSSPKPSKKSKEKPKKMGPIRPDDFIEREHLRSLAGANAETANLDIFDIYKKSHGMASYT